MATISKDGPERFLEAPLLLGVDEAARRTISRFLVERAVSAGTALLSQGEPNDRLWFLAGGSVAIERRQADGRVAVMANLSGPAVYGTTTFFRSTPPSASIRAVSDLVVWTLDRPSHERLRHDHPRAAEALALEVVRVLSDRFDQLDQRLAAIMAEHDEDHPRSTEWANFRAKLFEEPSL